MKKYILLCLYLVTVSSVTGQQTVFDKVQKYLATTPGMYSYLVSYDQEIRSPGMLMHCTPQYGHLRPDSMRDFATSAAFLMMDYAIFDSIIVYPLVQVSWTDEKGDTLMVESVGNRELASRYLHRKENYHYLEKVQFLKFGTFFGYDSVFMEKDTLVLIKGIKEDLSTVVRHIWEDFKNLGIWSAEYLLRGTKYKYLAYDLYDKGGVTRYLFTSYGFVRQRTLAGLPLLENN